MKIITAVDQNWAIGKDNDLVFHLKKDLAFFKRTTLNQTVIMGERTFYSLPFVNGQCLPNRKKVVLTDNPELVMKYNDWSDIKMTGKVDSDFIIAHRKDFVIGGAYTYESFMPYVDTMYITHIKAAAESADTYLPEACRPDSSWLSTVIEAGEEDGIAYEIVQYTRTPLKRIAKRQLLDGTFKEVKMKDLKKDDIFQVYEPCGKLPLLNEGQPFLYRALSDASYMQNEDGIFTWSINSVIIS